MIKYILLFLFLLPILELFGQGEMTISEGLVSYITQQNIYAKFANSKLVTEGDTIYIRKEQLLIPLFIAESVSSTSCVGKPLFQSAIKVSDVVYVKTKILKKTVKDAVSQTTITTKNLGQDSIQTLKTDNISKPAGESLRKQKIRGRLSASSYSSFSNSSEFNQRMRYTFSMTADHISGGKFSTDNYILFTHKLNHWGDVRENLFNALKIYSLSVNYDVSSQTRILIGRKINTRIASVGAIDGIQTETKVKNFTFGAVIGSNPDYSDYSFNPKLFEYGAYLSHDYKNKTGQLTNSFAFVQQTNSGKTDRRFAYFQQDNSLVKNLNLFLSCELDLYTLQNGIPTNTVSLTSLYFSMRYRFSRQLSLFASYDARKNVIYYETFKSYLDQMLEDATRQGYQFRINYNPARFVYSGISGGYRFRKNDLHPMVNANAYVNFPQLPWIDASVNFSANWLNTSYANGMIYGMRIYRDIIPAKLSSGVFYRLVNYKYPSTNTTSLQHMAEFELSWQIAKKISLSANYDGTFEKANQYNTIYLNLIKRF